MKINKRGKDQSENTKQSYECQKSKPEEKTAHPAKEGIAPAHAPPGLACGRPIFVFGPPRRTLTIGKARVVFHKYIRWSSRRSSPAVSRPLVSLDILVATGGLDTFLAALETTRPPIINSFIHKFITNTINCQNILWLAGLDFDLAANILDMRVNRTFIGFKRYTMDCI
jgi:hypothetical protein